MKHVIRGILFFLPKLIWNVLKWLWKALTFIPRKIIQGVKKRREKRLEKKKARKERYSPYKAIESLKALGIDVEAVIITFNEDDGISWKVSKGEQVKKERKARKKKGDDAEPEEPETKKADA